MFALVGITLIGALAANLVGRTLLNFGERTLDRMPIVRSVYKAVKQIFETALSSNASNFSSVGFIGYPREGVNVVCFIARELDSGEIGLEPGITYYSAFMPTTPNPTSGFLFFVEKEQVTILDLTVEEAAKLVISAGLVTPKQMREANVSVADEEDTLSMLIAHPEQVLKPGQKTARQSQEIGLRKNPPKSADQPADSSRMASSRSNRYSRMRRASDRLPVRCGSVSRMSFASSRAACSSSPC